MMTLRRVLLGLGTAALVCSIASADTLYSTSVAAPMSFTTDGNYTLTLNKFDSSLGNLTGATLYFYVTEDVTNLNFTNNTGSEQTLDIALTSKITNLTNSANSSDLYAVETLDIFDTGIGDGNAQLPASPGAITFAIGQSLSVPDQTIQNIDPTYAAFYGYTVGTGADLVNPLTGVAKTISGSHLGSYVASPLVTTFTLTGKTQSPFTGIGTIPYTKTVNATFAAEIDYTYTLRPPPSDTPEPTTLVLMGTALAGVGLLRKRIKV
jgi:hypothetical protein